MKNITPPSHVSINPVKVSEPVEYKGPLYMLSVENEVSVSMLVIVLYLFSSLLN